MEPIELQGAGLLTGKAEQAGDTAQAPRGQDDDEFTRRARLSRAKLIRRVYELDPLLCPSCDAGMKILALILDFGAAKAIRQSLRPSAQAVPRVHARSG